MPWSGLLAEERCSAGVEGIAGGARQRQVEKCCHFQADLGAV